MSIEAWSQRPKINEISLSDEIMRLTSSQTVKNQLTTIADLQAFLNPPQLVHAESESDLETAFGPSIIIPDNDRVTVSWDADFEQTKPFRIGANASLEVVGSTIDLVPTYSGSTPWIQNENPANPINSFFIQNLIPKCTSGVDMYDIIGTGLFRSRFIRAENFDTVGSIDFPLTAFEFFRMQGFNNGMRIKNMLAFTMDTALMIQLTAKGITFVSFDSPIVGTATINNVRAGQSFAGDSLFSIDPNSLTDTSSVVENSKITDGDFYQQGVDIPATAVIASGLNTQFDITDHDLVIGRAVVLKGFTGFTAYNGTHFVTAVNGVNSVDIGVGFLGADSSGIMNAASLDQTDIRVDARNNPGQPDSMFTGSAGLEIFGSEISSSSLAQNAFEVITSASWGFDNLERTSVGVSNEGQLVIDSPTPIKYNISYNGTIEKTGGGGTDIGIILIKNGSEEIAFNPPHTTNSGKIQIFGSDLVELEGTDTLQVAVKNYDTGAAVIVISQISLVLSKG